MSNEPTSAGWILHSLAQGRRFGPMSEDELRNYFRAGMVKSVDRLSAPGDAALLPAAEVAAMLEVSAPVGPPPPELPPTISQVPAAQAPAADAAPATADAKPAVVLDERAAKAIAAVQLELATRNAGRGSGEGRPAWLVPLVIVLLLVATLFYALSMLRKMKPPPSGAAVGAIDAGVRATPTMAQDPAEIAHAQAYAAAQALASATQAGEAQQDGAERERYQRADLLVRSNDWRGLLAHAGAWTQAEPSSVQAWRLLGVAHARLEDYAKSADAYNRMLLLEPGNADAKGELADVYLASQRWQEAADLYKALVSGERAKDARLWNNYGMALGRIGQDAQAVAALETAVRLDPAFKQGWSNLAAVYEAAGDATRASAARANAR